MKKIISLLSAIAMMFTLITTVAFADDNNTVYFEKTDGTNEVTLKLVLKTNKTITKAAVTIDLTDAYEKGATVKGFTQLSGATIFNVNTDQKVLSTTVNQVKGVTGTLELGTMTLDLSKVTEDFTLTQKRAFSVKNGSTLLTDGFTNNAYGYVVKAPVAETTEYTVTFKADDVEVSSVKVAENGTVATLPDAPAKVGYTFSKWVANGVDFTTSTVITANTTVTAEYTKNEEKYGTPITEGAYKGKTLYFNEAGATTFNFRTDKGIEITKTVGETSEKKVFGVKYLYDKGIEVENGGDATATFTIGIIDVNDLAKGTFSFRVLKSLE